MKTTEALAPGAGILVKLGSVMVHAEELLSPDGHAFDRAALETLLADPELVEWREAMDAGAFLPVLRKDRS